MRKLCLVLMLLAGCATVNPVAQAWCESECYPRAAGVSIDSEANVRIAICTCHKFTKTQELFNEELENSLKPKHP